MSASNQTKKILLIGIGNDGRSDDALGWRFADSFSSQNQFVVEYRYQLQIEDALLISEYEKVIFVDASREHYENGFHFYACEPLQKESFTTHALPPETILWLANHLFHKKPETYVMAIEGKLWELHNGLSKMAKHNLEKSLKMFNKFMMEKEEVESSESFLSLTR